LDLSLTSEPNVAEKLEVLEKFYFLQATTRLLSNKRLDYRRDSARRLQ